MKTRKVTQSSVEHSIICDGCDAPIDPRSTDQRYKSLTEEIQKATTRKDAIADQVALILAGEPAEQLVSLLKEQAQIHGQLQELEAKAQDLRLWKIRGWRGGAAISISEPSSVFFTGFDLCEKCIEEMPLGKVLRRVAERKPEPTAGDPIPSWGSSPATYERRVAVSSLREGVVFRREDYVPRVEPLSPPRDGVVIDDFPTHGGKWHGVDILSPGLGEVEIEEPRPEIKTTETKTEGETRIKTEPS